MAVILIKIHCTVKAVVPLTKDHLSVLANRVTLLEGDHSIKEAFKFVEAHFYCDLFFSFDW